VSSSGIPAAADRGDLDPKQLGYCSDPAIQQALERATLAIARSDAILIGAGAGMGVDSGLPDFRGNHGFWRAYPPYQRLGLDFVSLANPRWFEEDPTLAWGFYGHRMELYRRTIPHPGFAILRAWAERMRRGGFVFTSNVDGHFQRAGFAGEQIVEVHGSFEGMQCTRDCGAGIFPGEGMRVEIDQETMRAVSRLPECPKCGALARPNILMFGDFGWDSVRTKLQTGRMREWLRAIGSSKVVVIECGAGRAVPTVRMFCEDAAVKTHGTLIRINTREAQVPAGHISLPVAALEALRSLDARLSGIGAAGQGRGAVSALRTGCGGPVSVRASAVRRMAREAERERPG
jgi:NAD-dependent SIR2 family protein deacetylase